MEKFCKKYRLSPRESQILKLIIEGVDSDLEISKKTGAKVSTVRRQVHDILAKVGVGTKVKLFSKTIQEL